MHFCYAFINVLNYPAGGENWDSGVAYFKNPLFHTLLSVENQGVAKYKLISKCVKKVDKPSLEVLGWEIETEN